MQTLKVLDPKGVWLINTGGFSFVDPTTGHRFDPQIPTQATKSAWVDLQSSVIKDWELPKDAEIPSDSATEKTSTDESSEEVAKKPKKA